MFSGNTSQVSNDKLFVEDVFSTWLYTGTGAAQTITNGIDLAGKGGLVWTKLRNIGALNHSLFDTNRGVGQMLITNLTGGSVTTADSLTAFNSNGFNIGSSSTVSYNPGAFASWTFRKAPKFFDVVTYTGTGSARTVAHNLGVAPGCILVKNTSGVSNWGVYHRSQGATKFAFLNATDAFGTSAFFWNNTEPTATQFTVNTRDEVNAAGQTYVAYLFAHDATSDGIIQCGSYTGNGSATGPVIDLGWEPQWVLVKDASATEAWRVQDVMRGMPVSGNPRTLFPNFANAESTSGYGFIPAATGMTPWGLNNNANGVTYVYIAIRRGPMKTPTLGTSVFAPVTRTGTGANATVSAGFVTDMVIEGNRFSIVAGTKFGVWDRMRSTSYLLSTTTNAEAAAGTTIIQANPWDVMDGYKVGTTSALTNASADQFINWMFRRAPGFFDEVCYTGTGVARTVNHNLGVAPELMIVKRRDSAAVWPVCAPISASGINTDIYLNQSTADVGSSSYWNNTAPTSSVFSLGSSAASGTLVNGSGATYVAYLFASAPGVSKVGSYTGNGSSQTINCGFAAGARFVMIKRTDSTGDWYVWDTARGIVAGNDPYLSLNVTNGDITSNDTIDTDSSGFVVNQVAATNVNVSSATYIYLAIA